MSQNINEKLVCELHSSLSVARNVKIHIIIMCNFKYNKADGSEQKLLLFAVVLLKEEWLLIVLEEIFSCET